MAPEGSLGFVAIKSASLRESSAPYGSVAEEDRICR